MKTSTKVIPYGKGAFRSGSTEPTINKDTKSTIHNNEDDLYPSSVLNEEEPFAHYDMI
jgi:hypothetical protein